MTKQPHAQRLIKHTQKRPSFFQVGMATLLACWASISMGQSAPSATTGIDPVSDDAVWVATQVGPAKLPKQGSGDLQLISDKTRPLAVGIDEIDGRVWFFDSRILRSYDFLGGQKSSTSITGAASNDNAHQHVELDPVRNQLYVAQHKTVHRVSTNGVVLGTYSESDIIRDIALDRSSGTLFVATSARIRLFTAELQPLSSILPPAPIADIDFDTKAAVLWVATPNSCSATTRLAH